MTETFKPNVALVEHINKLLFQYIVPTYFLDENYYILAWNPAFENIFAKIFDIKIGQHAVAFVSRWENHEEALARSAKVFSIGKVPLVDHEHAIVKTKKYGLIDLQKMATQVPMGREMGWVVSYNIRSSDKFDLLLNDIMNLFAEDVKARMAGKE